jgi:hypothetical protein
MSCPDVLGHLLIQDRLVQVQGQMGSGTDYLLSIYLYVCVYIHSYDFGHGLHITFTLYHRFHLG